MSAINVIKQRNSVHVLTDGAGYDAAGTLLFTSPKIYPLLKHNAMVTSRGPAIMSAILAAVLPAHAQTYDELRSGIVEFLRGVVATNGELLNSCQSGDDWDVVVAGISESDGPDSYVVTNHAGLGIMPWTVTRLGEVALLPADAEVHAEFQRAFPRVRTGNDIDLERDGLRILEMQRARGVKVGSAEGLTIVGGFAQLASIDRRGRFSTSIIHHWPDRIGEKIGDQKVAA